VGSMIFTRVLISAVIWFLAGREDQQTRNLGAVIAQTLGAGHRFGPVGDVSIEPAADLIAKEPGTSKPSRPHRPLADHAAIQLVDVPHRRHLDNEPAVSLTHLDRGVIEVLNCTMFTSRHSGFEQTYCVSA